EGNWKVIAFWAVASGSQTNIAAAPKPMIIVDHFDSLKVLKLYNHLFSERTGLQPYFGNPMRAIFSDSYEFSINRHYSLDFIAYFKKNRGYNITSYLPANMQKGYNYVAYMRPNTQPDFSFSDQDWRLRYDYDITLSEILGDQFFKTSKAWMEKRDLLFRTQAYGLNMDMIAMAGMASIPETESMLGSEANLKVMTSGALLYNRPIVTAESVVFKDRAYTTTPQKIKLAVDKLFAAGVNQIIYHGVPYHFASEKLGMEGWYPFSSPFLGSVNFSSNLGEGNIFWEDQKEVNEYVSRVQVALRSGKAHADVLLYYPFLDIGEGTLTNDEEILTTGYLKDVEGPLSKGPDDHNPAKTAWAQKVFPLINQLEANGISWAWVNDASIQEAIMEKDGELNIRGNKFQALILANDSIIQLKTAQQIKLLADKGMQLLATGTLPNKQPSFLNWKENDKKTAQYISSALKTKNSRYINTEVELKEWIKQLHPNVLFQQECRYTRQAQREMNDGSRIQFIWNKSDQWQTLSLSLDKKYKSSYWMNADGGAITKNNGSIITYQMSPYGSVILYATTKSIATDSNLTASPIFVYEQKEILSIDKWNIKTDSVEIKDTSLFDWKNNDQLKFSSAEGIYTSSFEWNNNNTSSHYFLDLGKVCFTAEVYINSKLAGKRIYAPYLLDITTFLKQGDNKIEVRITPGQLNSYIGKAKNADAKYRQFKGKEDQLMSAGLIGPVVIRPGK
ncbi:MAG: glycosyl hydrolase, partial [Panacibacter sp.]